MAKYELDKIRNMGVIAHIDAGKTTTTEHLLYYSGASHRLGGVDEGTTTTDWMELEQEKGITIQSACVPFQWKEPLRGQTYTVNLIDTPGHVDFTAEVERSLRVLDGAVVVFDAQEGVQAQSETVWRQAARYRVPRLVFINKMDVVGADYAKTFEEVRERLAGRPVPVTVPIGSGSVKDSPTPFQGVIDLVTMEACFFEPSSTSRPDGKVVRRLPLDSPELASLPLPHPLPTDLAADAQRWREKLFDAITEADDEDKVTSLYLAGEPVPPAAVHELLRRRTLRNEIQPVLCGSGREHIGIQLLLNAICWYLPSPLDRPPVVGKHPTKGKEEVRKPDPAEPLAALVFKIQTDPHGELYYLRIYSGTLKANSRPYNPGKQVKEFVTKLYHVHADPSNKDTLDVAHAGDIVATIGPKESITGDTLCDLQHPILLESIQFADTVVSMSIEPESSADKQKLEQTLTKLAREDPTFRWHENKDTGQTLISGMGVLHLDIKTHRLREDYHLKVRVGKPLVSYRETIRQPVEVEGECVRQAGTSGLFGKIRVHFEHFKGEQPITVVNQVSPEALPYEFVAAAERGVRGALQSGDYGYPVIDVRATLLGGAMDQQLSNEVAFEAAGTDAVYRAMRQNSVLLEPVMRTEVTVPEEYLGAVTADLNARRAEITQVLLRGNLRVIETLVPLSRMFDYSDKVRSLSQGRAGWTMEPKTYGAVPPDVVRGMFGSDEGF
jgi:elongation factor G